MATVFTNGTQTFQFPEGEKRAKPRLGNPLRSASGFQFPEGEKRAIPTISEINEILGKVSIPRRAKASHTTYLAKDPTSKSFQFPEGENRAIQLKLNKSRTMLVSIPRRGKASHTLMPPQPPQADRMFQFPEGEKRAKLPILTLKIE